MEVGPQIAQGSWSKHEASLSSTWRELKAVYRVLCSLAPYLKGHVVKWFSDNQNVTRIVHAGSRKQHLQDGARKQWTVLHHHTIVSLHGFTVDSSVQVQRLWILSQ